MVRYIIVLHGYLGDTTKFWHTKVSELEKRDDVELVAKGMCYDRQEKYTYVDYTIVDLKDHIKDFHLSSLIQSLDDTSNMLAPLPPKIEVKKIKPMVVKPGGGSTNILKSIFRGLLKDGTRKDS